MDLIERFEAMISAGKDAPLIRYSLGVEYLKRAAWSLAIDHLGKAVELDPAYSAAWKQFGNALAAAGEPARAIDAYQTGIEVAERKGDMQAAKEMRVFLRRAQKAVAHLADR